MSYCLNPDCQKPQNPDGSNFCQKCGTKLLLAQRYRAIKPLAQGGFGRTLLAEDEYKPSKPQCVIKQFYPQGQNNSGKAAELFQQEAVRLEQLGKHPQIPELFAHLEQDSRQYIVQEFIDGQNLAEELAETGVFREKQICSLLGDLLPVLQFIHEGQVIHRDIKPENIIRRRSDGRLVLVDFGAAKYATGTALGKAGTYIGAAGYAAPEQLFGKAVFASDIYSLGVTCIHLLTDIESPELYDAIENAFVWRNYLPNNPVSDKLGRILDKMTHSMVKQRYQSASEVMQDLEISEATSVDVVALSPTVQTPPKIADQNISLVATLQGHSAQVLSVAFSPDGKTLASGSGYKDKNNCLKLWDVDVRQEICTIKEHSGGVNSIAFSPDGRTLAFGKSDTIKLWNVSTGQEISHLKGHSTQSLYIELIFSLAFSPDGKILASGSKDCTIKLWEVSTGREISTIKGHRKYINSVAFSPDGKILASGSKDKTTKLWNVSTGREIMTLREHSYGVSSVAFSPDGKTLATGGGDSTIKMWDVRTGQEISTIKGHSAFITSVAFSADGKTLASGSGDRTIKVWDVSTKQEIVTLEGHSDVVDSVAFSPNGQILASGSWDKTIKIWRITR
ncbi:protein kinase [Microcoleus sp. FACHB-SPT15]|uniref:WD40 repeat domain-containing serine/threonine-protein kinase n=1 Tax=Microcoleus sp. FACHB-SPT15 TaxID=2692830 RepID=UPI0017871DB3|nr:WD40 repeat domain-containing serine/threonine-protein kinase [Microcoleus sp. FACHB-SPT15]MBD1805589.1 protein kinase [Microcoleus sp. FACHB-SPT15]